MKCQGNTIKLADEYYEEGRQTFLDNRLEEAIQLIQNAIYLYKQSEVYEKYVEALNLMGVIYVTMGNELLAMDYYLDGLECAMEHDCHNIIMVFYNNIGSSYQKLGEHEKAIRYFEKSAKALEKPECMKEVYYDVRCLVTYINLAAEYSYLEDYDLAEKYIGLAEQYMEGEKAEIYRYTFLIMKCRLWWMTGKHEAVYEHMDELLESGIKDTNTSDYVQNMKDLCYLFREMKEYDGWKRILLDFEKYAKEQNSVFYSLIQTEFWIEYYRTIGEEEKYIKLCTEYVELHQEQEKIFNKERAATVDAKILLREKEAEKSG